jgi:hypothetical protein
MRIIAKIKECLTRRRLYLGEAKSEPFIPPHDFSHMPHFLSEEGLNQWCPEADLRRICLQVGLIADVNVVSESKIASCGL